MSGGGSWESSYDNTRTITVAAGGLLFLGPLLMILFRIVLIFLWIAALLVVIVAWFAVLFTGRQR